MKKLFFLAGICLSAGFVDGQTIATGGIIVDSHRSTIGYMKPVPGGFRSWYGYVVEDSHHNILGYIKDDGSITDSHYSIIGYRKSNGTLEDSHHSIIGHGPASGTDKYNIVFKKIFFK